MAKSKLDELPVELKELILRSSSSITRLQNISQSSPTFFHVYFCAEQTILSETLCNILGHEGLFDAQAALLAK